jgi:four helix bundle protein
MTSYKELIVWKKAFALTLEIYKATRNFPKEEQYVLISQMRRSAISIPSNIAEGANRRTTKEYIQFLQVAYGSAAELETQLLLAKELNYLSI